MIEESKIIFKLIKDKTKKKENFEEFIKVKLYKSNNKLIEVLTEHITYLDLKNLDVPGSPLSKLREMLKNSAVQNKQ